MQIATQRLILRPWKDSDREPFAALSADPEVMQHLMPLASKEASDAWIGRQLDRLAADGFCFCAVELKQTGAFIGSVGLLLVGYKAHFTPAVELGWRIARAFWGQGYAPEAARAAIAFGFGNLALPELVANTSPNNVNSQRVMVKLGMTRNAADDFDHPRVPEGSTLRPQVLYRLRRDRWLAAEDATPA